LVGIERNLPELVREVGGGGRAGQPSNQEQKGKTTDHIISVAGNYLRGGVLGECR
jgi:hypothetical protein